MLPTTLSATLTLPSGTGLLLDGPVSLRLSDGEATLLAAPLNIGVWLLVEAGRRASIETGSGASIEVGLGQGASYRLMEGSTIPWAWREASQIVQQVQGPVVILGSVDSGKSTLSTFLANEAVNKNLPVGLLDGDIGQSDIGPPATLSGAIIKSPILDLHNTTPDAAFFVGDTSPGNVPGKVISGLGLVKTQLSTATVVIVNTDGWLEGQDALKYKLGILEKLQPIMILALEGENIEQRETLNAILERSNCTALRLPRSDYARKRTRDERRQAREFGYRRHLQGSVLVDLSLDKISLRRFDSDQALLQVPGKGSVEGVLAGLLGEEGLLIGICRTRAIEGTRVQVESRTTDLRLVRTLELGSLILSSNHEEVGFFPYM